jgi:hypothetical protein
VGRITLQDYRDSGGQGATQLFQAGVLEIRPGSFWLKCKIYFQSYLKLSLKTRNRSRVKMRLTITSADEKSTDTQNGYAQIAASSRIRDAGTAYATHTTSRHNWNKHRGYPAIGDNAWLQGNKHTDRDGRRFQSIRQ